MPRQSDSDARCAEKDGSTVAQHAEVSTGPIVDPFQSWAPSALGAVRLVDNLLLWTLLAGLGIGLQGACTLSRRFRSQVTRDLILEIGTRDVRHQYIFSKRSVTWRTGVLERPTLAVYFDSAREALFSLMSPHAVGRIVKLLLDHRAVCIGNTSLLLWFFALTRFVLPIGRHKRLTVPLPDAYLKPDLSSPLSTRIVREPAIRELDESFKDAIERRANMAMLREAAGASVPKW